MCVCVRFACACQLPAVVFRLRDCVFWLRVCVAGLAQVVECKGFFAEALGVKLGCSIAVNGVCLTVTKFDDDHATFGLAPETISKTNLIDCKDGDPVNLEHSLSAGARNSGHYVQGHVDGTGTLAVRIPR